MTNDSASTTQVPAAQIGATTYGFPRIGRRRELKRALESYWSGRADASHLEEVGREVRDDAVAAMRAAGLDSVPVNTFSWYDQVLDTTVMVGAIPERFSGITPAPTAIHGVDPDTYFAMARGTADLAPLEMSKWFDTNYHYLVPEISPDTVFSLDPRKPLAELAEATELNVAARPVVVGPWTYLRLSKAAAGSPEGFAPLDRIWDLVEVYADLLRRLQEAGATWVQLDEPAAVEELSVEEQKVLAEVYQRLGDVQHRPSLFVATYFADPAEALPVLADCPVEAIGVDLTRGADVATMTGTAGLKDKTLVLGAVSGRNIWRTDLRRTLETLVPFMGVARHVAVSSSCSLLHVPYDVEVEQALGADLRSILAFADQKLAEIVTLQRSLSQGVDQAAFAASDRATEARRSLPDLHRPEVQRRVEAVDPTDRQRASRAERRVAQADRLSLPPLPTTTIGSFPQTTEVRKARAERRAGSIDEAAYRDRMRSEIANVISVQDELGLDVLVHGEPERNDMVQYFAEQLDGFATTELGWVQSYGSRCVRPPILFGDVSRPEPMTLDWISYAQGLTSKPVKAMLTGPVTMLTWSFVRDDQGLGVTADQVALALRDEIADLENAGTAIIQVDEPALREGLPLRASERAEYLAWSVASFRLATSGVDVSTQIHTHLCYSEFGEVIDAITDLGADVTSIEAARSHMELLADLTPDSFPGSLGPGVYDIHSPRVPQAQELEDLLASALKALPADRLWVNPDCGLKTRKYDEVEPALAHMVQAAADARGRLATA